MTDYGYIVIETPVGAAIYVDGVKVGNVFAPVTGSGTFKVDSEPRGAKIYLRKTATEVYHGLTSQTLTLPAGPIPYILHLKKDDFVDVYDLVYIPPGEVVAKTYHMERETAEEPTMGEEPTSTVTIRSTPQAEIWAYMEGAEGFVSYGMTPKTLTLKATRGMWVAMEEAKRARAENRITGEESVRFDAEAERRQKMIDDAKEKYDEAKERREDAYETLRLFRELFNDFLTAYNEFLRLYTTAKSRYNALMTEYTSYMTRYNAANAREKPGMEARKRQLEAEIAEGESEISRLEVEKAQWDVDRKYWTDILQDYETRYQLCLDWEQQMKDEYEEALVRAKSPYWMVTPGLLGTTYRLKLTKKDYADIVDKFTVTPGGSLTKDYALVKALDVTTPESLAPFIESTPPPGVPDMPYAHTWLYIVCFDPGVNINAVWYGGSEPPIKQGGAFLNWHKNHWQEVGAVVCGNPIVQRESCKAKFIAVPPGKNTFYVSISKAGYGTWFKRQSILKYSLYLAPGETRYITAEYTTAGITTDPGMCPFATGAAVVSHKSKAYSAPGTDEGGKLSPFSGGETYGEKMHGSGYTLCGRKREWAKVRTEAEWASMGR